MKTYAILAASILILNCAGTPDGKTMKPRLRTVLKNETMITAGIDALVSLRTFSLGSDLYSGSTHSEYSETLHFVTGDTVYRAREILVGGVKDMKTGKEGAFIYWSVKTGSFRIIKEDIHVELGDEYTFTVHQDEKGNFIRIYGIGKKKLAENHVMNLLSFVFNGKKGIGLRTAGLKKPAAAAPGGKYNLWVKMEQSTIDQIKKYLRMTGK